jgi:hypothetical protein
MMLSNTRLDGANVMGECLIAAEWVEGMLLRGPSG